jgi:hypothetical protein
MSELGVFFLALVQFRMNEFLIKKKEIKNQPDCTEITSTSAARVIKPDEPPANDLYTRWQYSAV